MIWLRVVVEMSDMTTKTALLNGIPVCHLTTTDVLIIAIVYSNT